jgi:transcriptional/translational regulatory protein YebC/TACO1
LNFKRQHYKNYIINFRRETMGRHGTIAGRKDAQDKRRAAAFTKVARLITVAARFFVN